MIPVDQLPARAARMAAGLTAIEAAKLLGQRLRGRRCTFSHRYLLDCERKGDFPLHLAETLQDIYADHGATTCRIDDFLPTSIIRGRQAARRSGLKARTRRGAASSPGAGKGRSIQPGSTG